MKINEENITGYTICDVISDGEINYYLAPRYHVHDGDMVIIEDKKVGTVMKTISFYSCDYETYKFFFGDADLHLLKGIVTYYDYE